MKLSLAFLFLTILLLCGVLLRAANNDRKLLKIQTVKQEVIKHKQGKDMEFVPNVMLLMVS